MSEKTVRIEAVVEATDKTEPAISNIGNKFKKTFSKFDEQSKKTEKSLSGWAKQKYQTVLEAKDKVGPILSSIGGNLRDFAGKTWSTTMKVVDLATAPLRGIMNLLRNPILQAGAVLGISLNTADTINTFKGFEAQMSQVKAISGASGSDYERLNKKAQEMGASTKFTATEAAQGFNYMAMAGWNTEQMEAGIGGILSLAAASGEDLGRTSDIVTDALTAFNMSADDATHFADVLAVASSNANTNVGMMGETFKYVGAASGALGYSIEDVALGIGLMANAGIKSSQAGTELNSIFTRLSTNTNGARDAIEALGISFYDGNGNARDFGKVLSELRLKTKDMNNEQKINLANTIAGQRAQAGLLAMLNASAADYGKVTAAIQNADGAAQKMSDTMLDNLAGSITRLQSAWGGLKLKLGERMAPYIREFAEWLTAKIPKIADAIDNVMDKVDLMARRIKSRWQEMTGSMEWKDADLLGKLRIAWDKMITEPLSEWWNGTGKAKVVHFAGEFGNFLGSALNMGIMGLLGFDTGGAIDEGASVGKSFAKGFMEGFDFKAVASKVMQAIGNIFKSAFKLLPGGEKAGLSSVLSAGLLGVGAMKIASPLMSLGRAGIGMGRLAKTVFGKGQQTITPNDDGTFSIGPKGLGLGAKIGKGLMGLGTKAYGAFTGGAGTLTGGAASAAGLAGVGGAIAGGAAAISGGIDVYRAIKADDEKAKAAYAKSAGWKLGGVGAGAAIGTAILPGLGTAIGAGIGGIVGFIGGNIEKKKYEEEMERLAIRREKTAEVYKLTGVAMDKVVFKSKELNEALENSEMTAEEFSYILQDDIAKKAQAAFGNVKLSLAEVDRLAKKITFGKQLTAFEGFNDAAAKAHTAYAEYTAAQSEMKEMTWKVGLGMELTDDDISSFKASVDAYTDSAKTYIEKSQYEATVGMKLIMGSGADTSVIDNYYASVQSRLNDLTKELNNRIEIALEGDYRIDTDEAAAINEIQEEIAKITNAVAQAQQEAELDAIKIKYSGAQLDYESFTMLQEELSRFTEEAQGTLEEAYISARASLELALDSADTEEARAEIQAQIEELNSGYHLQLEELDVRVGSFQLEAVATAWENELTTAFAGMEGTVQENLSAILNKALAVKPDVEAWSQSDIISWFGLDKIDARAAGTIATQIQAIASQISTQSKETITAEMKNAMPSGEELMSAMGFDFGSFTDAGGIFGQVASGVQNLIKDNVSSMDFGAAFEGLNLGEKFGDVVRQQDITGQIREALNTNVDMTGVGESLGDKLATVFEEFNLAEDGALAENLMTQIQGALDGAAGNIDTAQFMSNLLEALGALSEGTDVDMTALLESINTRLQETINSAGEGIEAAEMVARISETVGAAVGEMDFSGSTEALQANLQTVFSSIGDIDTSGIAEGVQNAITTGISTAVTGADYAGATAPLGTNLSAAAGSAVLSADNSPVSGAAAAKMGQWTGIVQSQTSAGISTTMPINVTANWSLLNQTHTFTVSGDGGGSASLTVSAHAAGGYVSGGPQLSWLAEEGWGEYIIPTNPSRRMTALKLLDDASKALGVQVPDISTHAAGGYVSGSRDSSVYRDNIIRLSDYSNTVKAYESDILKEGIQNALYAKEYAEANNTYSGTLTSPQGLDSDVTGTSETPSFTVPAQIPVSDPNTTEAGGIEGGKTTNVSVNINMTPEFNINGGGDPTETLNMIRANMRQMVDELSANMADNLKEVFANQPRKSA